MKRIPLSVFIFEYAIFAHIKKIQTTNVCTLKKSPFHFQPLTQMQSFLTFHKYSIACSSVSQSMSSGLLRASRPFPVIIQAQNYFHNDTDKIDSDIN